MASLLARSDVARVIRVAGKDGKGAIHLLGENGAGEFVRKSHGAE